jgi:nucleotide-binding universal stress UspA family protein
MVAYKTIMVGTDGSATANLAVDRAGAVAADCQAALFIVCAYQVKEHPSAEAEHALGHDAWMVTGSAPAQSVVNDAASRAHAMGADNVQTMAIKGAPITVLDNAVTSLGADLLVVGNVGLNTLTGRILGSVPQSVARRSGVDVLIVHTS